MRVRAIAFASAMIGLAAPAAAGLPEVEPGRYRCSGERAGSGQDIAPLGPGRELRVAFRMMRSHSYRTPLAFVRFEGPNGASRIVVGKARTDRPRMYAAVNAPRTATEDPIFYYPFRGTPEWIILRLTLDERGTLTVRSNQLAEQFRWGTVSRATLGCEAGEWEIDVWPRSHAPARAAAG